MWTVVQTLPVSTTRGFFFLDLCFIYTCSVTWKAVSGKDRSQVISFVDSETTETFFQVKTLMCEAMFALIFGLS